MESVTLALAILLAGGFLAAKAGQLAGLPSVTGYILAGVLLGPSGLHLITEEAMGQKLYHFTQIALMLIAFGIGEHLELQRLRKGARSVGFIGLAETSGAFFLVGIGTFLMAWAIGVRGEDWGLTDFVALGMLLGAVSVATAPAATLHVMRELRAAGPLTSTLMAVVAIDDAMAIMIFGIAVSAARQLVGDGSMTILGGLLASVTEILSSLILGIITGLLIDFVVHRLKRRSEMLTAGLALLLLCGEGARLLHLSPLLAGMAAGFTIVNRDVRDVRIFRTINAFEPPIYVLFFTLAGAHLHLSALAVAGWVGLVYFLLRSLGKILGAYLGASLAAAPATVRRWLGLALLPQAGVAIGLIFLIKGEMGLNQYASLIIPIVLASVVLSELTGPVCARIAVQRAGETAGYPTETGVSRPSDRVEPYTMGDGERVQVVPWNWERLTPSANAQGVVIFGASHRATVAGLARIATLIAHHHGARPLAVRVLMPGSADRITLPQGQERLLASAEAEVRTLGYELSTEVVQAETVASGILSVARDHKTIGIVLGHPIAGTAQEFQLVVDAVARGAPCHVLVVQFHGILHTERILAPVVSYNELREIRDVISSMSGVGRHRVTVLYLLPANISRAELISTEKKLEDWSKNQSLGESLICKTVPTEARLETIIKEAHKHDLLIMAADQPRGLKRLFFGSLAEEVAQHGQKPIIMVHGVDD